MNEPSFELLYWREIRERVIAANPWIGNEIDQIKNVSDFRVMLIRYPFGAQICNAGTFQLNINNELIPYGSDKIPPEIANHLNYNWQCVPLSIFLHNTSEWHITLSSHTIPRVIYKPGSMISLLTIFENRRRSNYIASMNTVIAGCRSLILLPKVAHTLYNERLVKKFKIKRQFLCPKTFAQQWSLFNELASSKKFEPWHAEILVFPKRFIQVMDENDALKTKLLSKAWEMSSFLRTQPAIDMLWSLFIQKNLTLAYKNAPFIIETAKHVVKLAMQDAPGYVPAIDNSAGPVSDLIHAYIDVYKIRYYLPVFMHAQYYDGVNPVYYSLHHHTFYHPIPEKTSANQTVREITAIKNIIEQFRDQVLNHLLPFELQHTWLHETLANVEFEFFHPYGEGTVRSDIDTIVAEDSRFMHLANQLQTKKDLSFPNHSVFFHGCIRIRPKNTANINPANTPQALYLGNLQNQQAR